MGKSMKISSHEVRAALDAYAKTRRGRGKEQFTVDGTTEPDVPADALRRIEAMPDERAMLVRDLRRKLLHGRYHVASADIVRELLGRLAADLLAQDEIS
jgi:hypothetical protein